jgi:phospholipase/carboxylesterase
MAASQTQLGGPHSGQPIRSAGEPLHIAKAALLMVHGRGAHAQDILSLTTHFTQPGFAYLAPQAADFSWYPNRFMAPIQSNQPWLSSALAFLDHVLSRIAAAGIPPERTLLLGFSQGACLALEYAARNARRFGGLAGLSGALIGPDEIHRDYRGSLAGTPVFLGCSDVDFHIPQERVQHAAQILQSLGGEMTVRLYPNMGHTINQDELDFVNRMMVTLVSDLQDGAS